MNLSVNCWITGQSPSALAEEISTYEANIQKDVYENHLKQGNRDDWNGYTLNLFKKHSEKYYTTDLEQYKFDKTECKACAHNAANYNLFAEHNGCRHCTKCLGVKNAAHEIKELDYNVSAREFPKAPEAPQKEQLSEPTEYEQAVQTFE